MVLSGTVGIKLLGSYLLNIKDDVSRIGEGLIAEISVE